MDISKRIARLVDSLTADTTLVAVSKTYPPEIIMEAYRAGQRVFGENRPQELRAKYDALPRDIRWHMIGNLQTNKIKYIAPFVELIHSVDSEKLLAAIDREAIKNNRVIDILMEVFIAGEDSKIGWDADELTAFLRGGGHRRYGNVRIRGLMGMASLTDDNERIRREFSGLKSLFDLYRDEIFGTGFDTLSMGMSSDWPIALECGSNMVRIGSMIFGSRQNI